MLDGSQLAAMVGAIQSDWGRLIARAEGDLRRDGLTPEKEGLLRYRLGRGLCETGDLYRAARELERVVALGERAAALAELQADSLYCMGLVHRLLGRLAQEVAAFRRAVRCHARLQQTDRALRCQIEVAWSLLLADCTEEALPELEAASAGQKSVDAPDLSVQLEIARALCLSQLGDRRSSDQCCLGLLDRPPLQPAQRADIAWILGLNALTAGNDTAAEIHAAIALGYALEAWWPPQMERVEQLRRRLACGGGGSRPSSPRG